MAEAADTNTIEGAAADRGQRFRFAVRELYGQAASAVGASLTLIFLVVALLGPFLAPYGSNEQFPQEARQPPSAAHLLGTDNLGRDILSRIVLGAGDVLALAGLGTLVAVILGTSLGLVSGYLGGLLEEGLMRFFDSLLAMPALLLALLLLGTLGPSRNSVLAVIAIVYTPIVARVVRSVTLTVKRQGFVEAARVQGEPLAAILFREILPSTLPALAVEASLRFSYAIFLVASLGFLGVGVQPPSPDWGLMVKEARSYVDQAPWALYFPAAAIALAVIGINLLSDGLKRVFQAGG
jgi:peptide/nickel transport system permease protein